MKKISTALFILCGVYAAGCCSIPKVANPNQIYGITKEQKIKKGSFGYKAKIVVIKDFRENDVYDEDITALKEKAEKYILAHADLSETAKNNLRELKVAEGSAKDEVQLLLGQPDRIAKTSKEADSVLEIWVYRINKSSVFTIIFLPVFFGHETYYLYFKDNNLAFIERHYLKQTFYASDSGMGLQDKTKK